MSFKVLFFILVILAINVTADISILSPSPENYAIINSTYKITWEYSGNVPDQISIKLVDNRATNKSFAGNLGIGNSQISVKEFVWNVSNDRVVGDDYIIVFRGINDTSSNETPLAMSKNFSIKPVGTSPPTLSNSKNNSTNSNSNGKNITSSTNTSSSSSSSSIENRNSSIPKPSNTTSNFTHSDIYIMIPFSELKQRLFLRHYVINFFFCLPVFVIRYIPALSSRLLNLSLEPPEFKLYFIVFVLLLLKYRSSTSAEEFLSIFYLYGKILNATLFYMYGKTAYTIIYCVIWGGLFAVLPQPNYHGPTKIIELSGDDLYEMERNEFKNPKIIELSSKEISDQNKEKTTDKINETSIDQYWVIFFYATWSPACLNFESTLAKTSLKYTTNDIHFGKINIEQYSKLADEFEISVSPTSLDLPTLILFKNGKEIKRLPQKSGDSQDNEEFEKIKSQTLRTAKATWDRLGWDRSMVSLLF
ncbi:hypothetical protein G9A89_021633 [Geosiphon pyriformis]|nr:hypothetical protein G9A89_021633 [Geosiphon pyriformis]